MADLNFDDLIPKEAGAASAAPVAPPSFDDLIPQSSPWWRVPAMLGSAAVQGAAQGVGAVGDLQGFVQRQADQALFDPLIRSIDRMAGRQVDETRLAQHPQSVLGSESISGLTNATGLTGRPELEPRGAGEKAAAGAVQAVNAALPLLAAGPGGWAQMARGIAQAAGSGALGETAATLFPNHPTLSRLGGAILGLYGGGKAFDVANKTAGAFSGAVNPVVQSYRNLGMEPVLAGDVTGNPTLQMFQSTASRLPFGGKVNAAREAAVDQWGNALENTAANLGGARTLQEAGDALQQNGKMWLDAYKKASNQAWGNLDLWIPPQTPVPLPNYSSTLSAVRNQMPGAPATAQRLQPALSRDLLDSLVKDTQKGPLTWQDVRGIRTRIGEMISDPKLVSDTGYADLKRIYGALSTDLENTAASQGPVAKGLYDQLNDLTRQGHGFIENVLSNFLGKDISPEKAASAALGGMRQGGTMLDAVRSELPQAANELAAYKLRDMAAATAGAQNAQMSRMSPGGFLTARARMAPEAENALFGNLAPQMNDLSTAANSIKETERFLNTSGTGTHNAVQHLMTSMLTAPEAMAAGYYVGGIPGAATGLFGSAVAPALPGMVLGHLTASPALTRAFSVPPLLNVPSAANWPQVLAPAYQPLLMPPQQVSGR